MASLKEKEIQNILKSFRDRTGIMSSTLFTEDGFLITVDHVNFNENENYHQSISALSAGIVSLAENCVEILKENNKIKQVLIQAGDQLDNNGFIIVLESVTYNIRLSVIFPIYLNLGVILFELNQTIRKLSEYFSNHEYNESLANISSLQ
ncbi:MAG: roadblock/LC7 domain-containing protein [Promethearchaeota archaeon]